MSITKEKFDKAKQCLIDNGIDFDEVETVLQALCYILFDEETERFFADEEATELEHDIQSCRMTVDEFIYNECRQDVIAYLSQQEEEYFTKRGCTKEAILNDKEVIDKIAFEHKKCVTSFGCDQEWSCKHACDCDPGFGN